MVKEITGQLFETSFGTMIVYDDQSAVLTVGDSIRFDGTDYKMEAVIPPSKPEGKWSLRVTKK